MNKNIELTQKQRLLLDEFMFLWIKFWDTNRKPTKLQERMILILEEYDFLIEDYKLGGNKNG